MGPWVEFKGNRWVLATRVMLVEPRGPADEVRPGPADAGRGPRVGAARLTLAGRRDPIIVDMPPEEVVEALGEAMDRYLTHVEQKRVHDVAQALREEPEG